MNKTQEWERTRRELKKKFELAGITSCEVMYDPGRCWRQFGLGFAHVDKRRHLEDGELTAVVIACNYCHDLIEKLPREEMRELIENIIKSRQVPID